MYAIIQQVSHIKERIEANLNSFNNGMINKDELSVLLLRYLTQEQTKKLLLKLGIV
jgi:hypothetical protein